MCPAQLVYFILLYSVAGVNSGAIFASNDPIKTFLHIFAFEKLTVAPLTMR